VHFLELNMSMVLCVFTHVQGWLSVCSSITLYVPSALLCGTSHMYWGLPLTCHVAERRVLLCHGYGWFSELVNAVVGCSGSMMYVLSYFMQSILWTHLYKRA
jgi:hypothetical protein